MSFYIKWEQNYIAWFKEDTEKWKTSFLNETVENADLHKVVWKKTMTTQEKCVK